jgi:hypothetical protein
VAKQYPCIDHATEVKSWAKQRKQNPKGINVACCVCSAPATHKTWIQVNWFRGDDEGPFKTCKDHRNSTTEILQSQAKPTHPGAANG